MYRMALLLAVLLLGLPSCDTASSSSRLGDAYVVEMSPAPLLHGEELRVTVSYGGGCVEHTFELGTETIGEDTFLWLDHDANGDVCRAYLTSSLTIPVPAEVHNAGSLRLYITETESIPLMVSLQ